MRACVVVARDTREQAVSRESRVEKRENPARREESARKDSAENSTHAEIWPWFESDVQAFTVFCESTLMRRRKEGAAPTAVADLCPGLDHESRYITPLALAKTQCPGN